MTAMLNDMLREKFSAAFVQAGEEKTDPAARMTYKDKYPVIVLLPEMQALKPAWLSNQEKGKCVICY